MRKVLRAARLGDFDLPKGVIFCSLMVQEFIDQGCFVCSKESFSGAWGIQNPLMRKVVRATRLGDFDSPKGVIFFSLMVQESIDQEFLVCSMESFSSVGAWGIQNPLVRKVVRAARLGDFGSPKGVLFCNLLVQKIH